MGYLDSKTTTTALSQFDTETVTITRRTKGATPGTFTTSTIYTGAADFQSTSGATFMGASGAVDQADAELSLDPIAGVLPACQVGDLVEVNSEQYTIVNWSTWTFPIKHAAGLLKRGVLSAKALK